MTSNRNSNGKLLVRYKNEMFDLTKFVHKHPGGKGTLTSMLNTDIDYKFENAMPHSDAAKYLINEYKLTNQTNNNHHKNCDYNQSNNNETNEYHHIENISYHDDGHQCTLDKNGQGTCYSYKHLIRTDDSMEHLVDWSRGMVTQIGELGDNYTTWVNKPVDRPLRLFDTTALEMLTKTPWWLVPCFWIPIIILIAKIGINYAHAMAYTNSFIALQIVLGIFLWTLLEYSLHRFVFHLDSTNGNRWVCTFHFLLHGLHHKVPFDPYRLVFPPFPATILATIIYQPLLLCSNHPHLLFAGGLIGYLCYDMMHYYIHHGSPAGGHMYYMKRYHYQHHFVHHSQGFGISTSIWDEAFGTKIILRKLKYILKW